MGFGFGIRTDFGAPSFTLFGMSFHYHSKDGGSECTFRVGLGFSFCGVNLDIGLFEDSWVQSD